MLVVVGGLVDCCGRTPVEHIRRREAEKYVNDSNMRECERERARAITHTHVREKSSSHMCAPLATAHSLAHVC